MKRVSIIIPCYNEEAVLDIFYQELLKHLDDNYQFILIFVDDGSKDQTLNIIKQFEKNDKRVKYISFSRNFGKEAAMYAGLKSAKTFDSDATIIMDADLQHPPALIKEMLKYYEQGYQHVYAKIKARREEPLLKTIFAKGFYKLYSILTGDKNFENGLTDFCLLEKKAIDAFLEIKDNHRFTKGIFSWIGFDKKCIEFDYVSRAAGKTKWSFKKLFDYAVSGIRQFSHFYMLIPTIAIIIGLGIFIYDLIINLLTTFNKEAIKIDIYAILILIVLRFIMKLLYDVRDQNLKRPMYLTKCTNIEEQNENHN